MFDEDYIDGLPDDPAYAGRKLYDDFRSFHRDIPSGAEADYYSDYLQAHSLLQALGDLLGFRIELPDLSGSLDENVRVILGSFDRNRSIFDRELNDHSVGRYRALLARKYDLALGYALTNGDVDRIQILINELRNAIQEASDLDSEYQARLLKRLEKLQSELHKRMSDFDRYWGLIGEAGVVLGKLGTDAKPIVDRIRELAEIIWRSQARAEQLPSNAPLPKIESITDGAP